MWCHFAVHGSHHANADLVNRHWASVYKEGASRARQGLAVTDQLVPLCRLSREVASAALSPTSTTVHPAMVLRATGENPDGTVSPPAVSDIALWPRSTHCRRYTGGVASFNLGVEAAKMQWKTKDTLSAFV